MGDHYLRNKTFCESLGCASQGIVKIMVSEPNFRRQLLMAVGVAGLSWWLRISVIQAVLMLIVAMNVLALEMVNSALETALDALHPDYHTGVERAKDMAAGAVLVASVAAVVIGITVLSGPLVIKFMSWLS